MSAEDPGALSDICLWAQPVSGKSRLKKNHVIFLIKPEFGKVVAKVNLFANERICFVIHWFYLWNSGMRFSIHLLRITSRNIKQEVEEVLDVFLLLRKLPQWWLCAHHSWVTWALLLWVRGESWLESKCTNFLRNAFSMCFHSQVKIKIISSGL